MNRRRAYDDSEEYEHDLELELDMEEEDIEEQEQGRRFSNSTHLPRYRRRGRSRGHGRSRRRRRLRPRAEPGTIAHPGYHFPTHRGDPGGPLMEYDFPGDCPPDPLLPAHSRRTRFARNPVDMEAVVQHVAQQAAGNAVTAMAQRLNLNLNPAPVLPLPEDSGNASCQPIVMVSSFVY